MVQATLGRNALVTEMVRLASCRHGTRVQKDNLKDDAIANVYEALSACYDDVEALRMVLGRFFVLYMKYMQVWHDMCRRVSGNVTVLEFVQLTEDRPGVMRGEPWSEARCLESYRRSRN